MRKLSNEYTIEPNFSVLAGPYSPLISQEMKWMESVVDDMKAGNIEYKVSMSSGLYFVERKGMIITKRK